MSKLTNIIPVSDLRQDAANLLKRLNKNNEPLIITQRGRSGSDIGLLGNGLKYNQRNKHERI